MNDMKSCCNVVDENLNKKIKSKTNKKQKYENN